MTLAVYPLLKRRNRRPFYVLEIDGLGTRFVGPDGPQLTSPTYNYVHAIKTIGRPRASLGALGGIQHHGDFDVVLLHNDSNQIADILLPVGDRAARRSVKLAESLPKEARGAASAVPSLAVKGSLAQWPTSGVFWVGQEAIAYTSTQQVDGVWSFTGLTRGHFDSQTQSHRYDGTRGLIPRATDQCTNWRGRRARLKMGWRYEDGSAAPDYWVLASGFIDQSPKMEDGYRITIGLVPWTHTLTRKVGGATSETALVQGYHLFTYPIASSFVYRMGWDRGALINERSNPTDTEIITEDLGLDDKIHTPSGGVGGLHDDYFDPTLDEFHPRKGVLVADRFTLTPTGYGDTNGVPNIEGTLTGNVDNNSQVQNERAREIITVTFVGEDDDDTLLKWPDGALQLINNDANVLTADGANGRWARIQIVPDIDWPEGGRGPAVVANLNSNLAPAGKMDLEFAAWAEPLWFGIDCASTNNRFRPQPSLDRGQPSPQRNSGSGDLRYYPHTVESTNDKAAEVLPIRGLSTAFWQQGEAVVLLQDNIVGNPTPTQTAWIRVEYEPQDEQEAAQYDGGKAFAYLEIEGVEAIDDDGTPVGYAYRITEESRNAAYSFGDFSGYNPCVVRPVVRFDLRPATEILLTLLLSGEGDGTNSAEYDRVAFGANLTPSEVDIGSFLRFPLPAPMRTLTLDMVEGRPLQEYLAPILRAMGGSLVMKNNPTTGARKVTLIPSGPENQADSIGVVLDGDWKGSVQSGTNEEFFNLYKYKINYDWRQRRFDLEVQYPDKASINANAEEVNELEEEMFGLYVPRSSPAGHQALLRPIFFNQRAMAGRPRRLWEGELPHGDVLDWYPGATVILNASDGRMSNAARGLNSVPARIDSIEIDSMANMARVSFMAVGSQGRGWAPSLRSSATGNLTTVAVNVNRYTEAEHPQTGGIQKDLGYLDALGNEQLYIKPGDVLFVYPERDFASRATRTVESVDWLNSAVTFTEAVDVEVGHIMTGVPYGQGSEFQKGWAHLGRLNETLGPDGDPVGEWS